MAKRITPQDQENNPNWKGGISKNNYHYKKLQKERYPERIKAREMVHNAVKSGRLGVSTLCDDCGEVALSIEAHHEDYSQPLKVVWLCKKCHRSRHE